MPEYKKDMSRIFSNKNIDKKIWSILTQAGNFKTLEQGEIIFEKGQPSNGLVCLTRGKVKISSILIDGKEKIFGILVAPAIFGETETLDEGLRMVSAIALSKVELTYISAEEIKKIIFTYPEIALFIIQSIGIKLRWTTLQVEDLSALHKIPYRLANLLLDFKKYGVFTSHSDENCLFITHEELASFINTSRPKVTTYLSDFANKGIIETKRGQIRIINAKALQKYVDDEMFTI